MSRGRNLHRLIGARMSRTIPASTMCYFCQKYLKRQTPATHRVWGCWVCRFACPVHAKQGEQLGYEVIEGKVQT